MAIIRVHHNKSNPYVILNTKSLNTKNLSLAARGLWSTLLSFPTDWNISVKNLSGELKEGEKAIRSCLKELINHKLCHYTQKLETFENGKPKWGKGDYIIFESPEDFKEMFADDPFGNPQKGDAYLIRKELNTKEKNKEKKEKGCEPSLPKTGGKPPVSSPAAHRLSVFLFEKLKEKNPTHKQPNLNKWAVEMDKILRIDKRSEEELQEVIVWAFNQTDGFWPLAIQSPPTLRKLYDKARMKINHNPAKQTENITEKNKAYAKAIIPELEKELYPKLNFMVMGDIMSISHKNYFYDIDLKTAGFKERLKGELIKRGVSSKAVLRLIS